MDDTSHVHSKGAMAVILIVLIVVAEIIQFIAAGILAGLTAKAGIDTIKGGGHG